MKTCTDAIITHDEKGNITRIQMKQKTRYGISPLYTITGNNLQLLKLTSTERRAEKQK